MRIFVFIVGIILLSYNLSAQSNWERTFGGWGADRGYAVKQTLDSGYLVVGRTSSFHHLTQFYIVKVDKSGELVWTNHLGGDGIETAYDVDYASDSGFAIIGITNSITADYDILFTKIDKEGDTLYTKTYGGGNWDFAYSLALLPDSGYIIAGETYSFGEGSSDAYLIRIDKDGDTVWTQTYGGAGEDCFKKIILLNNGDILAVGKTNSLGAGGDDVYIVKLQIDGSLVFENTLGSVDDEQAHAALELNSGEIMIAGRKHNGADWDGWVFKTDAGAASILDQNGWYNWHPGVFDQEATAIAKYKHRDSIVVGVNMFQDGFYANTVATEKVQISAGLPSIPLASRVKYVSTDHVYFTDLDTTFDGGFIYCGYGEGLIGTLGDKNIYLIKTDSLNNSGCSNSLCIQNKYDLSTGIASVHEEKKVNFLIYPNPTYSGFITINNIPLNSTLHVFNAMGQKLFYQPLNSQKEDLDLNKKGLEKGCYFVQVKDKNDRIISTQPLIYR